MDLGAMSIGDLRGFAARRRRPASVSDAPPFEQQHAASELAG